MRRHGVGPHGRVAAILACIAACDGKQGTLDISLVTAPGGNLDAVQTLHVTVTNPMHVYTIERTSSGFDFDLDLDASGEQSSILVDGLDAAGNIVDVGASPHFPLGPLDGRIRIYMAPPNSIAAAPPVVDPRLGMRMGALSYGAILVGGRHADDSTSDGVSIYNAFDHSLVAGMPLPAPRNGPVVAVGANGIVYIFGGDEAGVARTNLWRFDTNVAPNGAYTDFGEKPGFERVGEIAVPLGDDEFILTGTPPAQLFGVSGMLLEKSDVATLPRAGASIVAKDGAMTAIFAGFEGVFKLRGNQLTTLSVPEAARTGASVVALPDGNIGVFCGDVVRIDPVTGTGELIEKNEQRMYCEVAVTDKYVLVAGGQLQGLVLSTTADIYDARTLARIATVPLVVPRSGGGAIALPNGQILIGGGADANAAPIATLELFTPPN